MRAVEASKKTAPSITVRHQCDSSTPECHPSFFLSFLVVLLSASVGQPCPLLPSSAHVSTVLEMLLGLVLSTYPIHCHLFTSMRVDTGLPPVDSYSSSLLRWLGQISYSPPHNQPSRLSSKCTVWSSGSICLTSRYSEVCWKYFLLVPDSFWCVPPCCHVYQVLNLNSSLQWIVCYMTQNCRWSMASHPCYVGVSPQVSVAAVHD